MCIYSDVNSIKRTHPETKIYKQLRGQERVEMKELLKYQSATSLWIDIQNNTNLEIKKDGHMQNLKPLNVLHKAATEDVERLQLQSSDLNDLFEMYVVDNKTNSDPFMRHVSFPTTVHLWCSGDLSLMHGQKKIILHIDATGISCRKPLKNESKILYYGIVAKDDLSIITLAHMITSLHDTGSISFFLMQYKNFVIKEKKRWPLAQAITSDWSWVFIHGILQQWNLININGYLNIMYAYCAKKVTPPAGLTILKICFAHFIKMVSRTIKNNLSEFDEIKSMLLECTSLLCLSRSLDELDAYFKHICYLLLSKNKSKARDSLKDFLNNLKSKVSEKMQDLDEISNLENDNEDDEDVFIIELEEEEKKIDIFRYSPFYKHFQKIGIEVESKLAENEDKNTVIDNKYHAPKYVDRLLERWMAYVPLWSAADMELIQKFLESLMHLLNHRTKY